MLSHRAMVANILDTFDGSSVEDTIAGLAWYPAARAIAEDIADATGVTVVQAVGIIAHLSPRTRWVDNVHRAWLIATTGTCPGLTRNRDKAVQASVTDDPYLTFGEGAHKTKAFFANICGDTGRVCVDTWAARVAGVEGQDLSSRAVYLAIQDAYVAAAYARGINPREMQAITWCAIRGTGE